MSIIYINVPGIAIDVTEDADTVRDWITEAEKHNDLSWHEADEETGQPRDEIRWIEVTARRQEKQNEDGGNGDGTIDVPLHLRINTIVAVGG